MPALNLSVPHNHDKNTAVEKLKSFSNKVRGRYGDEVSDIVESWDGSSWTAVASLPAEKSECPGTGTSSDAFVTGGQTPPTTTTFEWSQVATASSFTSS